MRAEFGPDLDISPESQLVADLGFDSLELLLFAAFLDKLRAGFELPAQLDLRDATVGDAHYYLTL